MAPYPGVRQIGRPTISTTNPPTTVSTVSATSRISERGVLSLEVPTQQIEMDFALVRRPIVMDNNLTIGYDLS